MISNTDDHLSNHGFVFDKTGWTLSPAFDLNPVPIDIRPRVLSTAIDEADTTASLDVAFDVARHFRLKADAARSIANEVGQVIAKWRDTASSLGLTAKEI